MDFPDTSVHNRCENPLHAALIVSLTGETDPQCIKETLYQQSGVTYGDAAREAYGEVRVNRIGYRMVDAAFADLFSDAPIESS